MKVLLIYPEYPATFWSFKHALPFINKKAAFPPLGLLTVSSLLPREWEKKLIDMNVVRLRDKDLEEADLVFISGMIVQKKSAQEVILRAKSLGKFVAAGGPLFTTGYRDFTGVDSFVLNEGEITIPLFLRDLEAGAVKPVYTSPEKPDIAQTPIPDWSLINMNDYASMAVQISRGCPFNCEFCDIIIMNGRVPRVKSPLQVRAEFDSLYDRGWRGSLFIVDDNFIGNRSKVKEILIETASWMKEKRRPFTLFTEASINLADEHEIMRLMQKSNFNCVFVGIETPEEESLKACGKLHNTNKDLVEKVKILQRSGLQVQGGFIVGFDTDTHRTFDNMIRFIQKSGIVTAMVGLLNAFPETALYKRLKQAGRILKVPSGCNTDFTINFRTRMNPKTLIEGYRKVLHSLFSPRNYYKRIITHLKEYRRSARETKLKFWMKIRVLLEAVWKLGVCEKGKRYFWRMCLWTFFRKPHLMADAISLSIYGFHYRKVLVRA